MNQYDDYLNKCTRFTVEFYKLVELSACYNRGKCTLDELKEQIRMTSEAEYQRDLAYIHIANRCFCEENGGHECTLCKAHRQVRTGTYPTHVRVPVLPSEPIEFELV